MGQFRRLKLDTPVLFDEVVTTEDPGTPLLQSKPKISENGSPPTDFSHVHSNFIINPRLQLSLIFRISRKLVGDREFYILRDRVILLYIIPSQTGSVTSLRVLSVLDFVPINSTKDKKLVIFVMVSFISIINNMFTFKTRFPIREKREKNF